MAPTLLYVFAMRIHDLAFVALVAFGAGWTIAGMGLELMAVADSRSVLWLALSRFFLALAGLAFVVAFARAAWRSRHRFLHSRWRGVAAGAAIGVTLLALSLGSVGPAWWFGAAAMGASFFLLPQRIGGTA